MPRFESRALIALAALIAPILPAPALAQGFHAVFSRDGVDAWAVGDAGVTYRTLDAGLHWSNGTLGATRLRDVTSHGLTVLVVGDGGLVWRSVNSGGSFAPTLIEGAPELRAISMPDAATAFVVGASGTILETSDGGASWTPQVSGTVRHLNAVHFEDDRNGWAVGEKGTVLRTSDGGEQWTPVLAGTTQDLYGVAQKGSRVWVVGARGTALRSMNGGASWTALNLKLDAHSDVRSVWLQSADSVTIAGGGGFLRRSANGGETWDFPVHNMHGQIADLHYAGATGFMASHRHRVVMSTINRGTTWRFPSNASLSRSWQQKLSVPSANMRGHTFAINDARPGTIYCTIGVIGIPNAPIYRSQDEGETWTQIAAIPGTNQVNAFLVSPRDSNEMMAAVGGPMRLVKSNNYGQTWDTTLTHAFGVYGIPLVADPDHPDTVYFGGDSDNLFRSIDAGENWERWSTNVFRSPCDIVVIPDSSNVIIIGDGITGSTTPPAQYYKSSDRGQTFTLMTTRPSSASEIPGMANSRLRPAVVFGTNWAGGGVQRSTDYGDTWPSVSSAFSSWGIDIGRDDPNLVMFAVYSGGASYLSVDGGTTFLNTPITGANYSLLLRDRGLILAQQSNGIHKMVFDYAYTPHNTQSLVVTAPEGGEDWAVGTAHDIAWADTNVAQVDIELRRDSGSAWEPIAQVPGYHGRYRWVVPGIPTTQARIRVRDAWDSAPQDSSELFTISGLAVDVGSGPEPAFALGQNRPNPFTGVTRIAYSLPREADVDLAVYDLRGQRVAQLVSGRQAAGSHTVAFGAGAPSARGRPLAAVPAGVYFYRLRAGTFSATRKMLHLP